MCVSLSLPLSNLSFYLILKATSWECSTGPSACWSTASNLCMCLTASPHSSSPARWVLRRSDRFCLVAVCPMYVNLFESAFWWFIIFVWIAPIQLEKRGERRAEAEKLLAKAQEAGKQHCLSHYLPQDDEFEWWVKAIDKQTLLSFELFGIWQTGTNFIFSWLIILPGEQENIDKFSKRLVKVTKQHNDECKKLLTLMGVPYIEVSLTLLYPSPLLCLWMHTEDTSRPFSMCVDVKKHLGLYLSQSQWENDSHKCVRHSVELCYIATWSWRNLHGLHYLSLTKIFQWQFKDIIFSWIVSDKCD